MGSFRCLVRLVSGSGQVRYRPGERLEDRYLKFVPGRCRPNSPRAVAFDLKTFFAVIGNDLLLGDGFDAKLEWLTRVFALTWLIDAAAHDAAGIPKHLLWAHAFSHDPVPQASKVNAAETARAR